MSASDAHSLILVAKEGTYGFGKNSSQCLGKAEKK